MNGSRRYQEQARVGLFLGMLALLAPALVVAARGVFTSSIGSIAIGIALVLLVLGTAWPWLPTRFEGRGTAASFAVWLVACAVAAYELGGVAIFMGDASRSDLAYVKPGRALEDDRLNGSLVPGHYCATAYAVASELAAQGADNLYDSDVYRLPADESEEGGAEKKPPTTVHEEIGETFSIDTYQYPPTFLLLPGLLMAAGGGFEAYRAAWFGLEVAALVLVLTALAHWLSPGRFGIAWFALPAILLAPDMLTTLQIGNVHFLIFCMVMGGMLALEKRRHVLGGLLLAFGIVGKVFPVVLLAYLAARRAWRALLFTCGGAVLYALAALAAFGPSPFGFFWSYQLPRLWSGEAFSFLLQLPIVKLTNASVTGVPHKLALLGLDLGDPDVLADYLTAAFSLLLLVATVSAGLRHARISPDADERDGPVDARGTLAAAWLGLLVLAQMQSPLLPTVYGSLAPLWLVCLLAATTRRASPLLFLPLALALAMPIPLPFGPPTTGLDLCFTLATLALTLALSVWAVLRRATSVQSQ